MLAKRTTPATENAAEPATETGTHTMSTIDAIATASFTIFAERKKTQP